MPTNTPTEAAETVALRARRAVRLPSAKRGSLRSTGPLAVLVALFVGFSLASGRFFTVSNIHTLADQAALLLIIATGLTFVILQGSIDLSIEGITAMCAMLLATIVANNINSNAMNWLLAVSVVMLSGAAIGVLNGVLHAYRRLPSLMVTLGMWFVGLGVANFLFPGTNPTVTNGTIRSLSLGHWLGFTKETYLAVGVVLVGCVLQRYTRFGRYSYAIGGSEAIARMSGINVRRYKVLAFMFSGALAAIGGVLLVARLGQGLPTAGSGILFPSISAVVIGGTLLTGGTGGVGQTVVGVLIITILANGLLLIGVDPYLQQAIEGAVIVAGVVAGNWQLRERMRVVK